MKRLGVQIALFAVIAASLIFLFNEGYQAKQKEWALKEAQEASRKKRIEEVIAAEAVGERYKLVNNTDMESVFEVQGDMKGTGNDRFVMLRRVGDGNQAFMVSPKDIKYSPPDKLYYRKYYISPEWYKYAPGDDRAIYLYLPLRNAEVSLASRQTK